MSHDANLLRQEEAWELLRSVEDPVVNQLMNRAAFIVTKRFTSENASLAADFDLQFFMEVMRELFTDGEAIRKILDGEDLRMWSDDD
ncbi:MAG TPA: hypothetical protein VNI77_02810 [Nitrososphaera sp.]|nr:hypothetical protein [Nitrososphaera sp.]